MMQLITTITGLDGSAPKTFLHDLEKKCEAHRLFPLFSISLRDIYMEAIHNFYGKDAYFWRNAEQKGFIQGVVYDALANKKGKEHSNLSELIEIKVSIDGKELRNDRDIQEMLDSLTVRECKYSPPSAEAEQDNDLPAVTDDAGKEEICPTCKEGVLLLRNGKYGPFWSCSRFPKCKYKISINAKKRRAENADAMRAFRSLFNPQHDQENGRK